MILLFFSYVLLSFEFYATQSKAKIKEKFLQIHCRLRKA